MVLYGAPLSSHLVLKKVSDPSVVFPLSLVLDSSGAPSVTVGSTPEEATQSGQLGVIKIENLRGGPGQLMASDPSRYEAADGINTGEGDKLVLRGAVALLSPIATNQAFPPHSKGGLYVQPGGEIVTITPTEIYSGGSAALTPDTSSRWTGSWAVFGRYVYFGAQDSSGEAATVGMYDSKSGSYSLASFDASYVTSSGDKLWRAEQNNDDEVSLSWTDDITVGANPTFSTRFVTGGGAVRDLFVIGGSAVVAIHGVRHDTAGSLSALDTSGFFTPLVQGLPYIASTAPLLGGQVIFTGEGTRVLWMPDIGSYRELSLSPFTRRWTNSVIPRFLNLYGIITRGASASISDSTSLYFTTFGTFQNQLGSGTSRGSAILRATFNGQGFDVEVVATPETVPDLVDVAIAAMYVHRSEGFTFPPPFNVRNLYVTTFTPNGSNTDIDTLKISLWEDMALPSNFDTKTKFLRTSRYSGDHWHTKKPMKIRGLARSADGAGEGTLRLYLDGSTTAAQSFTITADNTPFSLSVGSAHLGRDFALQYESTDNQEHELHLPLEIDYFAVPEEQDMVQLIVLGGFGTPDAAGGVSDESRATVLANLKTIVESEESWTLDWWDGTPQWTVYPISYQTRESDPSIGEGTGALVVTLTLRRV